MVRFCIVTCIGVVCADVQLGKLSVAHENSSIVELLVTVTCDMVRFDPALTMKARGLELSCSKIASNCTSCPTTDLLPTGRIESVPIAWAALIHTVMVER